MNDGINKITIGEFEKMENNDIYNFAKNATIEEIVSLLVLIKEKRAISWTDRLLLQMIDKSPLTFWASDRTYKVRLWEGKCESVYKRQMLGKEFPEFISRLERRQAMLDSINIINADTNELSQLLADFENYYTKDIVGNKAEVSLVTNSMQLIDEDSKEKFYAEIGLPIDLLEALKLHEARKKEFDKEIEDFEKKCSDCSSKANKEKQDLLSKISVLNISRDEKKSLREICINKFSTIEHEIELGKKETATNLGEFIDTTISSIQIAKEEVEDAISNTSKNFYFTDEKSQKCTLKELLEQIRILKMTMTGQFMTLITEIESRDADDEFQKDRDQRISAIIEKRDEFLRNLSDLAQQLQQVPSNMLSTYKVELTKKEEAISKFIANEKRSVSK